MAEERCRHEMLPGTCVDCRPRPPRSTGLAHASGPTIAAQYPGTCAHCGDAVEPGDSITRSDDEDGWCLTDHTDYEPPPPRPDRRVRNEMDLSEF